MSAALEAGIQTTLALQRDLQALYDLPQFPPISDFLLFDRDLADRLTPPQQRRGDERLLLREERGELALSLFLDPQVLHALAEQREGALHERNLQPLLHAIEGVSHWLAVYWHALRGSSVSPLELELQAEIDKYALIAQRLLQQRGSVPRSLHPMLFDPSSLDAALRGAERDRYVTANWLAASLWRRLLQRNGADPQHPQSLCTLRRFYRLDREGKRRLSCMGLRD